MEQLGERLKSARERSGLTQMEAAARLGISNGTLSGYERNYREPDAATLLQLGEMYGVSLDFLLTGRLYTYKQDTNDRWAFVRESAEEPLTDEEVEFLRGSLALFRKHAGRIKSPGTTRSAKRRD